MKAASKVKKIRLACLQNAESFIDGAKNLSKSSKFKHIQYHLAALALEEIGKAELIGMKYIAGAHKREPAVGDFDNHIKKLFWALWGPSFGKDLITKQQIEQYQGLASVIHRKRLASLYIDPGRRQRFSINKKDVDQILTLANARLKIEQGRDFLSPDDPSINKEEVSWFLEATDDEEKRRLIFGKKAQSKLIELGGVKKWVHWLKEQFGKNEEEIRRIISEELNSEKSKKDLKKPKWRIKVRINSESHSIRNKSLSEWNQHQSHFLKLSSDDKRDLICEFFLSKSVSIKSLFWISWGLSRTFVTSLNIATKGFFWWHIPKDRARFYEEIWDLERNLRTGVEISPELSVNFKDLHWVLKKEDLLRTSLIFYYLTKIRGKKKLEEPFNYYVRGLSFVAKNDIHLRLELNAFESFFMSLKTAFQTSGDWNQKDGFTEAVGKWFSKLGELKDLEECLRIGEEQQSSPTHVPSRKITLTEVFGMKLYTDLYLESVAKKFIDKQRAGKVNRL